MRESKDPGITQVNWLSYNALQHNYSINNSNTPTNRVHLLYKRQASYFRGATCTVAMEKFMQSAGNGPQSQTTHGLRDDF